MKKKIGFYSLSVVVILALLAGLYVRGLPAQSFPQTGGELKLTGLSAPVDIYRDAQGIPHIYATSTHDLFMAQGYVHAQERFFQMDFWRHIGSGRLSEMFGKDQLDTDIFLRRLGWARVAQQELDTMDPESLGILKAYAEGVNAYLKDHSGTALSLEYGVLKLINSTYTVEPWTPLHSLTWAKAMAWDLRGNMDEEADRTVLLKTLTAAQVDELYPPYPANHPVIVTSTQASAAQPAAQPPVVAQNAQVAVMATALKARSVALNELLGPGGPGAGSNNWVISGALTSTGSPLLANDPHLGPQMPSIWFEVGLHCAPKTDACPLELVGFSFAGAPGVVIGHNDHIAWGFTNVGPDVQDVYIEKINPSNADQYEVNGQWVDMTKVTETVKVAGGEAVSVTVRYTRHGPILWEDEQEVKEFAEQSGVTLPAQYRLALRWTALEPSTTFPSLWQIDKAQTWEQFRAAAALFDVPAQNFVYADVDGNIGYQMPGRVPIRAGGDGRAYVPGWTDAYEWTGYIPFDELPSAFNPPEGFIATANNAVTGANYPYLITTDWDYGYRAQRIVDLIKGAPGKIDAAYIQSMQGDDRNLNAATLVPLLRSLDLGGDARLERARDLLAAWDGQQRAGSNAAALFEVFWKNLLSATFKDDLPEDLQPEGGARWFEVVRRIAAQPDAFWWDNHTTPAVETRDDTLRAAFTAAVAEIEKLQGTDPAKWQWGKLHTITFRNKTLGESGIAPIEAIFNRGPFVTSGGDGIVNATGWDATEGYAVDWLPSMRMIVDLGDFSRSLTINTTGQSGHAYHPHNVDMAEQWASIQYHPMRWNAAEIQSGAEGHLRLTP